MKFVAESVVTILARCEDGIKRTLPNEMEVKIICCIEMEVSADII